MRRRTLRRLQPYQRRDAPEAHPLWHLHWLSNIDKHQVLHTTLVGLGEEMPPPGEFSKTLIDQTTGEIEYVYTPPAESIPPGGAVSVEVTLTVGGHSEGDVRLQGDLPFHVEIEQPGTVLHQQPVLRLMDGIRAEVEAALAAFRPLL